METEPALVPVPVIDIKITKLIEVLPEPLTITHQTPVIK